MRPIQVKGHDSVYANFLKTDLASTSIADMGYRMGHILEYKPNTALVDSSGL